MRASAGHKILRSAIQTGELDPVYYLYGAEEYLKEDAVRQLVDAAVDAATRDFNFETLRAADVDAETLGSLLATPPMMAARRVVVVRDVGALRKDARAVLDRYLAQPARDVVLVLVAAAGAKEDRALLTLATAVDFAPLSGARLPKWITYYASNTLGCEITEDAAGLLQDAVGTELASLKIELDKLASYVAGEGRRVIDEEAVTAVVGVRRGETMGDLLDAIARRDAKAALGLLSHILLQPKTSAVTIVMALSTQTLALACGKTLRDRGTSTSRLESELYALLKESGSSFTGRSWGDAVRSWTRHVDSWMLEDLDAALAALLDADVALKDSRVSSEEQVLATLVLSLCGVRERTRARVA